MKIDFQQILIRIVHDWQKKTYPVQDHDLYIHAAIDWLKRAQDVCSDGGVSAQYSLFHGWDDSYVETTGYILVSFFDAAERYGMPELRLRAVRMADFLLKVQLPNGAFQSGTPQDIPPQPRVFNTGEDIRGLVRAFQETGKQKYLKSAKKACDWLVSIQEEDGSWLKDEFQKRKHAYHSRTAWALLLVWKETKIATYRNTAEKCLQWVLKQQKENGWFGACDFSRPPDPFTHAIDYTISGLLEAGRIVKNATYWKAGKDCADALLRYYEKHQFMPATFNEYWKSDDTYACLTGDAQIVISWLLLYKETRQKKYMSAAEQLLTQIKQTVDLETNALHIRGAVAGAYPLYGGYSRLNYPNWATKFFLDACMMIQELKG